MEKKKHGGRGGDAKYKKKHQELRYKESADGRARVAEPKSAARL